jgi:hypothetical protein
MDPNATCYTIVNDDTLLDSGAAPSIPDLRNALQKGSDELKLDTMRRIIVGTLNGQNYVSSTSRIRLSPFLELTHADPQRPDRPPC